MNWLGILSRKGWRFQVLIYQNVNNKHSYQKYRKHKWVLPMHLMHAQPYHFLACAPIFLQILEEQYGSPQGAWSLMSILFMKKFFSRCEPLQ